MRKRISECMHALCCLSPVPMESEVSSPIEARSSDENVHQEASRNNISGPSKILPEFLRAMAAKGDIPIANDFGQLNISQDGGKSPQNPDVTIVRSLTADGPTKAPVSSGELLETQDNRQSSSQNANVGGILHKWVNFGKGWRPRWFVLQEGVLSYYKVHGPDKITLSDGKHRYSRIIGEESQRLMKKQRNAHRPRKAFGELHLQVASIRKSKSDDKRFYIFTGTKTLHLRAETKEDRATWLEVLNAAKEQFPRSIYCKGLAPPSSEIVISTERLRDRLLKEGLPEDAIGDCEAIMRDEFSLLQDRLMILEQRNINLFERLRQLEAEKVELETTVMDESQSHVHESGNSGEQGQGASETDTDDDRENNVGPEAETDEEDDVFFDTKESLVTESFGHSASLSRQSSADLARDLWRSDSAIDNSKRYANGGSVGMELVGFNYPHVKRRKGLPQPKEKEKGVSLWSMIKDNIGKDLTKICLPVYFNEPISSLQKCFEDLEYSYLLDRAYEYGRRGNNLMRILNVAAFAISGYASTEGRTCKPFNPLLGETYEADYPDRGLRFISEKVSHHPMIVACHCQGRGWVFWGDSTLKSKFWGRSIQLDPVGILTLKFADGEIFQWSKVTTSIYNLILGKIYCDHYGTMRIQGNQELFCKLKFKEHSVLERNPHQVQGYVHDKSGDKLATLFGKWDESMYYILGDLAAKPKGYDPMSEAVLLWRCNGPPEFPTRYNLTEFAITLNELTPGLKERLPPTDSRLRPDQRHLENGEYELANAEKLRLEQKQRRARKLQERGWQPRWFRKGEGSDTFEYLGGYWEVREEGKWDSCPDIFGPTTPEEPLD